MTLHAAPVIDATSVDRAARNDRLLRNLLLGLMVVGFVVRIISLEGRALHHDESLDAWFSQKVYRGTYDGYDPVYHGPLRFYLTTGLYWLFGISVASARLISVLAGTVLVGVPWLFRRSLGRVATASVAAILCFSPSFVYFSRFAREDAFFAFLSLLFVALLFVHLDRPRTGTLVGSLLTLVAAWAVKESVFLLVLVVGSYLLVELALEALDQSKYRISKPLLLMWLAVASVLAFTLGDPIVLNLGWWGLLLLAVVGSSLFLAHRNGAGFTDTRIGAATVAPGAGGWALAVGAAAVFFVALFTQFFTDWSGTDTPATSHNAVVDGLVGGWDYWRSQQDVNRGGEPWYYYLFVIPVYEYVTVLLAGVGAVSEFRSSTRLGRFALWGTVVTFAAYSYAGERMPWLVLHPLLPMVLLAGIGVRYSWRHRQKSWVVAVAALVILGALATARAGYQLNYVDGENPRELLSQAAQASPELKATVERLYELDRLVQADRGRPLHVVIDSGASASWPYVFYLRDLTDVSYADLGTATVDPTADVVVVLDRNAADAADVVEGWDATPQAHREWWVPSYLDGGISGWWGWLIDRDLWPPDQEGGLFETVYVAPDVAALEAQVDDPGPTG